MVIPGGHSNLTKNISSEVQEIANQIRLELEEKIGTKFSVYLVLEYKQQVVAGMIYHMKIRFSRLGDCAHVRIFLPLSYTRLGPEVQKYELHSSSKDPLELL